MFRGAASARPSTEVRVGSYDFDNTGHIFSGVYSGSRYDGNWPLDDDYANFRNELWLSTDRAFKTAVESMARKRASLNNSAASSAEPLPDFSKVAPVVSIGKVTRPKIGRRRLDGARRRAWPRFSTTIRKCCPPASSCS